MTSSGSKGYEAKSNSAKGFKDFKDEKLISPYGQGTPSEERLKFLDEMSGLRKEFAGKRSVYFEVWENPKSNPEDLARQQSDIRELFQTIEEKNTHHCR